MLSSIEGKSEELVGVKPASGQKRNIPTSAKSEQAAEAKVSDPALGAALNKVGNSEKSAIPEKTQKFYDEVLKRIDKVESVLGTIKTRTDAMAIKA